MLDTLRHRLHGADTLLWDRVSRNICYAPGYTIMGGTTQILRNIVAAYEAGLISEEMAIGATGNETEFRRASRGITS